MSHKIVRCHDPDKNAIFHDWKRVKLVCQDDIRCQTNCVFRPKVHRILGHYILGDEVLKGTLLSHLTIPTTFEHVLKLQIVLSTDNPHQFPVVYNWNVVKVIPFENGIYRCYSRTWL